MGIAAGIVGLPNVGKSTIFNALCAAKAAVENYPFCTIDPNTGIVAVPDNRLSRLTAIIETRKVVPAFLELIDVAGLVKGASRGEGLGNQFLGHIRNVDAIVHVVRCFADGDVVHVDGTIDPVRDAGTVNTELMLKDLDTLEKGLDRVRKAAKSGDKELGARVVVFERAHAALSAAIPIRAGTWDEKDLAALGELRLLTAKRVLYVANVDEDGLAGNNAAVEALMAFAAGENAQCVRICGKIEAEIAELASEEQAEFLQSMGLEEPGLHVLSRAAYRLLELETFFTSTPKETRAWTIRRGTTAVKAAGRIHTDMERGFICAEVFHLEDLEKYGSEGALRAAGKIRQEGRDYVIQDGDIVFFRFNV